MHILYKTLLAIFLFGAIVIFPQDNYSKIESEIKNFLLHRNYTGALEYMNDVSHSINNEGQMFLYYGDIYLNADSLGKAVFYYQRAIEKNNSEALMGLGEAYFREADLTNAKLSFEKYLAVHPDSKDALKYLGQIAIAEQNIGLVENYYMKIYYIDSTDAEALLNLGIIYSNSGKYNQAENFLLKSIKYDSDNPLTYRNIGILYGVNGKFSKAIEFLNKALLFDPANEEVYYTVGVFYLLNQNTDEAEFSFNEALQINPDLINARIGLIILYEYDHKLEKAQKELDLLSVQQPDNSQINLLKANLFYLKENYVKAIDYTLEAIKSDPENPDNFYLLSRLYELQGKTSDSEAAVQRADKLLENSGKPKAKFDLLRLFSNITNFNNPK